MPFLIPYSGSAPPLLQTDPGVIPDNVNRGREHLKMILQPNLPTVFQGLVTVIVPQVNKHSTLRTYNISPSK